MANKSRRGNFFIMPLLKAIGMDNEHNNTGNEAEEVAEVPTLALRKSSNVSLCDICFEPYHIMGRWPMLACVNQHFFCDVCLEGMFKISAYEPVPCPICRTLIRYTLIRHHYELFRTINKENTVEQALKTEDNKLFHYAFQHEIFEVASAFKSGKLETISKFTKLDCSNRKIVKIEHMDACPSLVYLRFDKNVLLNPSGLDSLQHLRYLNLSHNKIKDATLLGSLRKLAHLGLQYNQIEQIPSLIPFSSLSHFYLLGNPLNGIIIDEFLLVNFKNLKNISISTIPKDEEKVTQVFLKGVLLCETMPKLSQIFVKDISQASLKKDLQYQLRRKATIHWTPLNDQLHDIWMNDSMTESYQYGQVFHFHPDKESPYFANYSYKDQKLTKITDNFLFINSSHEIHKGGKINFKIKIDTLSQHVVMGLCNGFLKHQPNIYSEHFVGLTFWGGIYARGNYSDLTGKLRLQDKPVIRMSVDFDNSLIRWFSDDVEIGKTPFPQQFKHSSVFFVLGMRDAGTAVVLLKE